MMLHGGHKDCCTVCCTANTNTGEQINLCSDCNQGDYCLIPTYDKLPTHPVCIRALATALHNGYNAGSASYTVNTHPTVAVHATLYDTVLKRCATSMPPTVVPPAALTAYWPLPPTP